MKNKIVTIGDIHFGIKESPRLAVELEQFLKFIDERDVDIVVLTGDYFDRKLSFAEPAGLLALQFWSNLLDICRRKNIKIRMIEGTLSHDEFQPDALSEFITYDENGNPDVDFRFIKTVEVEMLNDMKVLYVPEEYPLDANEYYDKYKNDKYDIIFLHGMWDTTGLASIAEIKRNDIQTAPFFIYNEWKDALSNGVCISGHYHGRTVNKDMKIVYPGAFTAWGFDYMTDRGWCYLEFDTDDHSYKYDLITNTLAPKYCAKKVNDLLLDDIHNVSIDELKLLIDSELDECDYIRVDLTGLDSNTISMLKQVYKDNKYIKIISKAEKLVNESFKNKEQTEENKYQFILDNNMPIPQMIGNFAKIKYNKTLSEEEINAVITEGIDVYKTIDDSEKAGA